MNVNCIQEQSQTSITVTQGFLQFLEENLNIKEWKNIVNDPKFNSLISMYNEYGDSVFHDLVNLVANRIEISIKELLMSYSAYRNEV